MRIMQELGLAKLSELSFLLFSYGFPFKSLLDLW